ncbi:hypothetical protein Ltuc_1957 [Legionella tucsonensis]|uniref:Uncharacterized protein n=2 Tax=Legionella tucsonensis TaxID=40335 RepID=A0A0W0ZYE0_9GAMM|nr:hypothetical protein Ltuc_1957 [Legionella tucsonensis]
MGFYFNTFRQQEADKAYNEQRYEEALMHYSEALKTLNLHAASNSVQHSDFYDALVYVLSEIVTTKLQLIRKEAEDLHFDNITKYWQDIPSLLHEIELIHSKHLAKLTHALSNKEQVIRKTHELLAAVCEEISDELVDQLEDNDEKNLNSQVVLSQAIEWMNRAITFQEKTKDRPKLSSSLGYLNLLEQHYKETGNEANLHAMSDFISKYKLLEVAIQSPLRKLELLSYVIRLAIFNLNDTSELVHECEILYGLLSEEDKENPILDDLQNLVNLVPLEDNESEEESQLKDMESTEETHPTSTLEESTIDSTETDFASEEFYLSVNHPDIPMEIQYVSSEVTQPLVPEPSSMSPFKTAHHVLTQQHLMLLQSSSQGNSRASQVFFSNSFQAPLSEETHLYSKALHLALKKITADSHNPKFLANLLCLIADFFSKYRADGIQKQNAIVIAFDLYQQVLKIDPTHHRAHIKLNKSSIQNKSLIGPYKFFNNGTQSLTSVATQISTAKDCFNQALEELTIQLESFLMNNPSKIEKTINNLIDFIGDKLSDITSTPSSEIRATLTQTFREALLNSAHSSSTPINF